MSYYLLYQTGGPELPSDPVLDLEQDTLKEMSYVVYVVLCIVQSAHCIVY